MTNFASYASKGIPVVPIRARDKRPGVKWKSYQTQCPTSKELERWWGPKGEFGRANAALILGRTSGLCVVDCDSEAAISWAEKNLPPTPLRVRTGKGLHLYFRMPSDAVILEYGREQDGRPWLGNAVGGHVPGMPPLPLHLDFKAEGGYVIAPGSTHKSGRVYEVEGGESFFDLVKEIPTFDPGWLNPLCFCGRIHKHECSQDRNGLKIKQWLPVSPPPPSPTLYRGTGDRCASSTAEYRAERYVDKIAGAVQGAGGDLQTFRVACDLVRGFELSENVALQLLQGWNDRCSPPWNERDLRSKITAAARHGKREPGYLLNAQRNQSAPQRPLASDTEDVSEGEKRRAPKIPSFSKKDRRRISFLGVEHVGNEEKSLRSKLFRLSSCGTFFNMTECTADETHDDKSVTFQCCEDTKRCPYCAHQHSRVQKHMIARDWPKCAVLEVKLPAFVHTDPAGASKQVRNQIKERLKERRPYRWVVGHERYLFISPIGYKDWLKQASDLGRVRIMSGHALGRLVAEVWQEPAQHLLALLRKDSIDDALDFVNSPYMTVGGHYPRTGASHSGLEKLPWPSIAKIREELSKEALERRGGVDFRHCCHQLEQGICGAPLKSTFVDGSTGTVLLTCSDDNSPWWSIMSHAWDAAHYHKEETRRQHNLAAPIPIHS